MTLNKKVDSLLRIGVAFTFIYPPISALFNPFAWIGYFPAFALGIIPDLVLLHLFGAVEIVIGLWILSGRNIFIPSAFATVMLITIVIFNISQMDIVFRDLSIAAMSLALALKHYPKQYAS